MTSTPDAAPTHPQPGRADIPFTPADRDDLIAAHQRTLVFESFLLDRFAAYTRSRQVKGKSYGRSTLLHPIDDPRQSTNGGYGHWHIDPSWRTRLDQDHVVVYLFVADDRGPGDRAIVAEMPWAWVFGDTEREERRAAYEALRAEFEGDSDTNPASGPVNQG